MRWPKQQALLDIQQEEMAFVPWKCNENHLTTLKQSMDLMSSMEQQQQQQNSTNTKSKNSQQV